MPRPPTDHKPGEPADGWSIGFNWNDPLNRAVVASFAGESKFFSGVVTLAKQVVAVVDSLNTVLGQVKANDYADRDKLPPFPLDGTLAPLGLVDVTVGLGAVSTLLSWALTPVKFPQYDQTTGDVIANPPAVAPIDVLRRIAKAGG